MKGTLQLKELKDISQIINGGTPKTGTKEYWDGNIFWITPKDLGKLNEIFITNTERKITSLGLQRSSAKLLPINSLILSSRAPIGHLAITKVPISTNQGCKGIVVDEKNNNVKYVFYFLKKSVDLLNDLGSGTTFKEISGTTLGKVKIPIPSLNEQQAIVEKLDFAFDAIEKAKANIEKNIENAKELFQSKLNEIFSQKGEGWENMKLIDVTTLKSGSTLDPNLEKTEGEIPYLKVADLNLTQNIKGIVTTSSRFINKDDVNSIKIIPKESIIFPKRGGAILTNKKRFTSLDTLVDLNTMAVIANKSKVQPKLIYYFFLSINLSDIANGTTILQINNYSFDNVYIRFPSSLPKQQEICNSLENLYLQSNLLQEKYKQKLANLEELKKSILEKAFKGELI